MAKNIDCCEGTVRLHENYELVGNTHHETDIEADASFVAVGDSDVADELHGNISEPHPDWLSAS